MWRPFSANHLRHSFCCYCTETTRLFVFLQKKKREAVGTWLVIFSLYVRLQTVGESLQALKSIFILQLSLKRVIVQIKWNYMKHHLYTISYSTLLLWQVFLCLKSINHFMILFSLKLYESSRKKFTWNRNKWQWFKFWTVASRCGRYKLFLYSYPCVLLCTSAAEEKSVRLVPMLNLPTLWVSILEMCQKIQLLATIWGLLLFTTSAPPLLHPYLQGCHLTNLLA